VCLVKVRAQPCSGRASCLYRRLGRLVPPAMIGAAHQNTAVTRTLLLLLLTMMVLWVTVLYDGVGPDGPVAAARSCPDFSGWQHWRVHHRRATRRTGRRLPLLTVSRPASHPAVTKHPEISIACTALPVLSSRARVRACSGRAHSGTLVQTLRWGVGLHYGGMAAQDRELVRIDPYDGDMHSCHASTVPARMNADERLRWPSARRCDGLISRGCSTRYAGGGTVELRLAEAADCDSRTGMGHRCRSGSGSGRTDCLLITVSASVV
jgi:hypothetical protein